MKFSKGTIVLLLFIGIFACSPERMVTRKIEGKWNLVSIDGEALPLGTTYTLSFDHDSRSEGKVVREENNGAGIVSTEGIYSIMKTHSITMAFSENPNIDTKVFDIEEYTKTTLKLTLEKGNHLYVFEK